MPSAPRSNAKRGSVNPPGPYVVMCARRARTSCRRVRARARPAPHSYPAEKQFRSRQTYPDGDADGRVRSSNQMPCMRPLADSEAWRCLKRAPGGRTMDSDRQRDSGGVCTGVRTGVVVELSTRWQLRPLHLRLRVRLLSSLEAGLPWRGARGGGTWNVRAGILNAPGPAPLRVTYGVASIIQCVVVHCAHPGFLRRADVSVCDTRSVVCVLEDCDYLAVNGQLWSVPLAKLPGGSPMWSFVETDIATPL
ncbi:hypothetical protein C8Q80DRAFT_945782 [Daedaleopsis nitida]|nr:hypothetical protein C8Q80DRAFT_945782 [Daedaleopsis nitida]